MNPTLLELPAEFSSERLHLRRYLARDTAMYFNMLQANWNHLYEYLPQELMIVKSEEDVAREFTRQDKEWDKRALFIFGAWAKVENTHVGECYLANADWKVPRIEVGYFVVKDQTGKGYASEMARAAAGYAFEHMQVLRVDLNCTADNTASQRVAEKCGFTLEGRSRQHHRKKDGTLVDTLWYGLLRSDWDEMLNI